MSTHFFLNDLFPVGLYQHFLFQFSVIASHVNVQAILALFLAPSVAREEATW